MAGYFKRDIVAWMDGTEGLTDGQYRVYDVILNLIYLQEGPIVAHEAGIAGRCNMHRLAFRTHFAALIQLGKLVHRDGKISNARAESEIAKIGSNPHRTPRRPRPNPPATSPQPTADPPATSAQPPREHRRKPLKTKEAESLLTRLDETRLSTKEAKEASFGADAPLVDVRTDLFRRGLSILRGITGKTEQQCRGLLGKWLRDSNDDAIKVLRVVEDAQRDQHADPVSWIVGALKIRSAPRGERKGFLDLALELSGDAHERHR